MGGRVPPRIARRTLRAGCVTLLGMTVLVFGLPSVSLAGPTSSPSSRGTPNDQVETARSDSGGDRRSALAPIPAASPTSEPAAPATAASSVNSIALPVSATVSTAVTSKSALNSLGYGLQSPSSIGVCTNCVGGEQAALGKFASGTQLVFHMTDNTCAKTFVSTDSTHARVAAISGSQWTIGWDDAGAGCGAPDGDFNDLITSVTLAGPSRLHRSLDRATGEPTRSTPRPAPANRSTRRRATT